MTEGLEYLQDFIFCGFLKKRRVNEELEYLQSYFVDSEKKVNERLEYLQSYHVDS